MHLSETRLKVRSDFPWISKQREGGTESGVDAVLSYKGTVNSGSPMMLSLLRRPAVKVKTVCST